MDSKKSDICVFCHYARMKKDICGIYCAGSFRKKPDGTCDHFEITRSIGSGSVQRERKAVRAYDQRGSY